MESIIQLLSTLKENEKSILIVLIANALVLYLICFIGFEKFQTFQWHQQIIIPCALSTCYTSIFFFLSLTFSVSVAIFVGFSDKTFSITDSGIIWYQSIFCLNTSTIASIIHYFFSTDHCFSVILFIKFIIIISWICFIAISVGINNWKNNKVFICIYFFIHLIIIIVVSLYIFKPYIANILQSKLLI